MNVRPPRVLVVDDAPTIRLYHRSVLTAAGFEVHEAFNGYQALETVLGAAPGTEPDLLLVDVNMPEMDGITLVRALRDGVADLSTPVVVISTEDQASDRRAALTAGANLFLVKPVPPEQLVLVARMLTGVLT